MPYVDLSMATLKNGNEKKKKWNRGCTLLNWTQFRSNDAESLI